MKKLLLLTIIFLITVFGITQTFEKYYKTSLDEIVYDAIEINYEEIIFVLNYGNYLNSDYQAKLFRLNHCSGEFTDSADIIFNYPDYKFTGSRHIFLLGDSIILIIGNCIHNITEDFQIFVTQYDMNFNYVCDTVAGNLSLNEGIGDIILTSDSILVIAGWENFGDLLLEERKINGEFIRKKTYSEGGLLASTLFDLPSINKYHLYRWADGYHAFNVINKNDLSVDTIIQYPLGFEATNAIKGIDSSYYYVAGRNMTFNPPKKDNLSYIKVNSNGEIIQVWEYLTDSLEYYTYNSFSFNDDYIFFGGAVPCTWIPPLEFYPEQRWILLYKISHNGEIAWQKFYKGEVNYMAYKVLATNDGGALIFSTKYDWNDPVPNQRDLHILKIDSTGYYTPLTGTAKELEQMQKQILVYPNPVENDVNFVFGLYKNLEINIFDLSGKKIYSNTFIHSANINIAYLKSGIYTYTVSSKNGFFEEGKIIKK